MGLIGLVSDIDSIRQMENRQNPKVYKAYSRVLQKKELIVDIGRMGGEFFYYYYYYSIFLFVKFNDFIYKSLQL